MNNLREEAERILETFRQLEGHDLDNEDLMINFLENGLKRAWLDGGIEALKQAREGIENEQP